MVQFLAKKVREHRGGPGPSCPGRSSGGAPPRAGSLSRPLPARPGPGEARPPLLPLLAAPRASACRVAGLSSPVTFWRWVLVGWVLQPVSEMKHKHTGGHRKLEAAVSQRPRQIFRAPGSGASSPVTAPAPRPPPAGNTRIPAVRTTASGRARGARGGQTGPGPSSLGAGHGESRGCGGNVTSGLAGRRGRCPRSSASGSLPARPLPCAGPTREDARSPGPPLYQLGFDSQVLVQGWMDCVRMNGESPWEMVPRRKAPLLPGDTARSAAQREAPGSATAAAPPSRRSVPRRALGGPPRPRQRGARLAPRPAPAGGAAGGCRAAVALFPWKLHSLLLPGGSRIEPYRSGGQTGSRPPAALWPECGSPSALGAPRLS